jgi:mono/diheme cytochrome c family protein
MNKLIFTALAVSLLSFYSQAMAQTSKIPKKTPELLTQGKKLYDQDCMTCHGPKGDGKGQLGAALKPSPTDFTKPSREWPNTKGELKKVFEVISNGIPNSAMAKWDQLSEQERWALVYVIVGFSLPPKKK